MIHMPINDYIVNRLHKVGSDEKGFIYYRTTEYHALNTISKLLERGSDLAEEKCNTLRPPSGKVKLSD